jgi:hypothetical protein
MPDEGYGVFVRYRDRNYATPHRAVDDAPLPPTQVV